MDNAKILKMFENYLAERGIMKSLTGAMTLDNTNFGILPRQFVHELISLVRSESAWLSQLNFIPRDSKAGTFPIFDINGNITEGRIENESTPVAFRGTTRNAAYSCKGFTSEWHITLDDLREAAAGGIARFEEKVTTDFATALRNDIANIIVNGNTSLDSSTSLNRMLKMLNGIEVQSDAGIVYDAEGKTFNESVFAFAKRRMPQRFRNDPDKRFLYASDVEDLWRASLTKINLPNVQRTAMGDQVLTSGQAPAPEGVPQIVIPQMSAELGRTSAAPTDVTNNGTTLTFRVHTILPDTTNSADRAVLVTCKLSGESEICRVTRNGSNQNIITTTTLLRQSAPSTTASDYTVREADLASIHHANPKSIHWIQCMEMRSYRKFVERAERIEIITHFDIDVLIPTPEAYVKVKNVHVPTSWAW